MRLIAIEQIEEGMKLAKPVYDSEGRVLLSAGTPLRNAYIKRLNDMGIYSIYVEDDRLPAVEVDDVISEKTRLEATLAAKDALEKVKTGLHMDTRKVTDTVNNIMDDLLSNPNVMVNLIDIRSMKDYTFAHSVSVCVLSILTGIAMGYTPAKLKELGYGAILHDIGKAKIPENLLNKPGQLSAAEVEEIQKHPHIGFEILRSYKELSIMAAHVAWQHHERYNGSGYPRGLKGDEINEYARIVAVADVYDALTTDRVYRKRFLPYETIEYITANSGVEFDPEVVKAFTRNIAVYPVGSTVRLNSGETGVVVKVHKGVPTRPVVKIIKDSQGKDINGTVEVDLMKSLTTFISEVIG